MSGTPPEPLPPDLLALLDAERDVPEVPADEVERALTRVLRTVQPPVVAPPAPPAAGAAVGSLLKRGALALAFATGVAVGAGGHAVLRPSPPPIVRVVERRVEVPGPERVVERRVEVPVAAPTVVAPSAVAPSGARTAPGIDTAAAERALIDQARNALVRANPEAALRAVREHEQRFPRGALDEERDGLRVQALAAAGRGDEARARAAEFHRRHPGSLLGASVDRAVAGGP